MPAEPVLARALSNTRPLSPACVMSTSHRGHRGRISRRLEAESAESPLQAVIAHLPGVGLGQRRSYKTLHPQASQEEIAT